MKAKKCMMWVVIILLASGCASMQKRKRCILKSAAAGAVMGGGAGVAIGNQGDTDNRVEGSIIGAATGAAVGGVLGFIFCEEEIPPQTPPEELPPVKPEVVEVKQEPEPEPETPKVVKKIILNGIRFDFDRANIKPEFYPVLDEAVKILNEYPEKKVIIKGYTCSIGTEAYNKGLSLRRAISVRNYLSNKGLKPNRLRVEGYGEGRPIGDNATLEGRRRNRRVEFKVINDE